jgi:hypothetical protein
MSRHNPSFVLHVGDYVRYGETDQAEWDNWLTDVQEHWVDNNGLTIPIVPAIGNHEGNGTIYYGQFALPGNEKWYSLDWGPDLHITVLSTQDPIDGEQLTWLREDLAAHESTPWKVVIFHEPPYTSAIGHSPRTDIQATWCPVFDNHHVDLVFCGHSHNYERTFPLYDNRVEESPSEGTVYVVTGGWGAPLHDVGSNWWTAYSRKTYNFVTVEIIGNRALHLKAYDRYGNLFDELYIQKGSSASIRLATGSPPPAPFPWGIRKVRVNANLVVNQGDNLCLRFLAYDNKTIEWENVIWSRTTPGPENLILTDLIVPHDNTLPYPSGNVKRVKLVLTDSAGNVILDNMAWEKVIQDDWGTRVSWIILNWGSHTAAEQNQLGSELTQIILNWAGTPSGRDRRDFSQA